MMTAKPIDTCAMNADFALRVEVLTASGCAGCQHAKALVKAVLAELADPRIDYHEVNVIEQIDYAVRLRVARVPAIALGGELVFSALPRKSVLRRAIQARLERAAP